MRIFGETLNVEGAAELQVLAETYNRFYKENRKAQRLIRHRAEHDSLTDLLNRGSFDRILRDCEENRSSFALIIIDADRALYRCKFTGKSGCSFYFDVPHDKTGKAR